MSLCFFAILAMLPESYHLRENLYRQLPLYRFLEKKAGSVPLREDPETSEKIIAVNGELLGRQVQKEQQTVQKEDMPENAAAENASAENGSAESAAAENASLENAAAGSASPETAPTEVPPAENSGLLEPAPEEMQISEIPEEYPAETEETGAAAEAAEPHPEVNLSPEALGDYEYLLGHFFILDPNAATNENQLNAAGFLEKDLTVSKNSAVPQILIYHSHSQEAFADSREGEPEDTIVGVGNYLARILTEQYGYQVMHVTESFDIIDGEVDRSRAYDYARACIEPILEQNPSIEVVIDLHRDGVQENRRLVTEINGKETAMIMFFNGLSCTAANGPVEYLPNPYIQDNLAFSFQLEYQAALYYPGFYRGIYLAGLRYNLHLKPRALLLEAGAQTNTVQEVKNAMEPFADILNRVLQGT